MLQFPKNKATKADVTAIRPAIKYQRLLLSWRTYSGAVQAKIKLLSCACNDFCLANSVSFASNGTGFSLFDFLRICFFVFIYLVILTEKGVFNNRLRALESLNTLTLISNVLKYTFRAWNEVH